MSVIRYLLPLVLIAGCQGVDGSTYIGRPGSPAWFSTASPATIADYYVQQCAAYGYRPGTPAMMQCIQSEAGSGRQMAAARSAAVSRGMAQASNTLLTQQPPPRRSINCTSTQNGPFTNTSCY